VSGGREVPDVPPRRLDQGKLKEAEVTTTPPASRSRSRGSGGQWARLGQGQAGSRASAYRHLVTRRACQLGPAADHGREVPVLPPRHTADSAGSPSRVALKEEQLLADSDGKLKRAGGASTNDIRHGFVYERVQHITLKSIANNPDIVEGMTRDQIDAAIKKHADFETLYDRPYEDKHAVRVAGPFTVESLSPHRSLAFASDPEATASETGSEAAGEQQPDAPQFEASILENLTKAGIQNGLKGERIEFESIEPHAGTYIQAVATQKVTAGESGSESTPLRIGIALGPQYGTVSQGFAASAVKEAVAAGDIDLLCVLGFAFDALAAEVTESDGVTVETSRAGFAEVAQERAFGKIKMLLVRMNVDLLMGEELKKTGAGNLFTVFGEPDLEIRRTEDGEVVVELHGVDVYDPTTGEVRSRDTDRIALWMIDTDYNGDSFFVRHCYFTGGGDPYKRLKTALKAEVDADAWASLYGTVSRPFPAPSTGRIAVKVINDYGDEVMKIFEVDQ
jgi:adenine-specific DNA-methyltransferase